MTENNETLLQIKRMADVKLCELELDHIPCEMEDWFENTVLTSGCRIQKKVWRSVYNNYVFYEYEPFTTAGFKLRYTLVASDESYLKFFIHLYDKRMESLNTLKTLVKAD